MKDTGVDVVTGASSYTGSHIASRLLADGRRVRTLTGHPRPQHPLAEQVEAVPYRFGQPDELASSLAGATTLYNTYWVRFPRGRLTYRDAVEHSRALFDAAARAGVRRIVHVSIANPSAESRWGYFRGKWQVEQALADGPVAYSIIRPTVVFGGRDVLINNIAWLLRRLPVFALPGRADYPVRPVFVEDLADLCVRNATAGEDQTHDAVGPDTLSFEEMVGLVREVVGSHTRLVHVPPAVVPPLTTLLGVALRDVLLTTDELGGLMEGLCATPGPATAPTSFVTWVRDNAATLGHDYASELQRHYRHS